MPQSHLKKRRQPRQLPLRKAQERRTGTVASPDTSAAAFVVEQREQSEGEHAEETESGTTDEAIDLDDSPEAIPAYPAR